MGTAPLTLALRDSLRQRGFAMDGSFTGAATPSADLYIETPASSSAAHLPNLFILFSMVGMTQWL